MTTKTAGQNLTDTLRRIHSVGPRTRTYRNGENVKDRMLESLENEYLYPGYYQGATQEALREGIRILHIWNKHVRGYRIDGELAYRLSTLTPWQFAAYLGRMVDAGLQTTGDGEYFFQREARQAVAA